MQCAARVPSPLLRDNNFSSTTNGNFQLCVGSFWLLWRSQISQSTKGAIWGQARPVRAGRERGPACLSGGAARRRGELSARPTEDRRGGTRNAGVLPTDGPLYPIARFSF